MQDLSPEITIIYVNYRTAQLTLSSVQSVERLCGDAKIEIIVVDNASGDNIEELLADSPSVKLIKSAENLGFGRANNLGMLQATGRYVLFLNTDTELLNAAPRLMASFLEANTDVGAVGANLYSADEKPNQSFIYCSTLWSEIRNLLPNVLKPNHYAPRKWFNFTDNPIPVGYISGAAVMLRREWLVENGAFDPDFFMYYEDMELSQRVRKTGLKVVNLPAARIIHLGGGSSSSHSAERHRLLCDTKYLYFAKTHSRTYASAVYIATQGLYWIYANFAGVAKRTLFRAYILNNRSAWRKTISAND